MKLTTKCRYGARAVLEIAKNYGKRPTKRKDIVESQGIPDSYLENILISLKNRGIINATRGPQGGFNLKKPPESITMMDVILSFEESFSPVDCLDDPSECKRTDFCLTRPVWRKLQEAQEGVLKNVTIQELLEEENQKAGPDFII